jgi:hypothetical protein
MHKCAEQITWDPLQDCVNQARGMNLDVLVVEDEAPVHFKAEAERVQELIDIPQRDYPPSSLT